MTAPGEGTEGDVDCTHDEQFPCCGAKVGKIRAEIARLADQVRGQLQATEDVSKTVAKWFHAYQDEFSVSTALRVEIESERTARLTAEGALVPLRTLFNLCRAHFDGADLRIERRMQHENDVDVGALLRECYRVLERT